MKTLGFAGSLLAAVALLGTGCMVSRDYYEPAGAEERYDYFDQLDEYGMPSNLDLLGGELRGDFGPVRGVDKQADIVEGYDDGSFSDVQVIAETERGAAMTWIEIVGGINHPALHPGFSQRFTYDESGYDARNLSIRAVNCSGEQTYDWTYDAPADEVEVTVEEGPEPETVQMIFITRTFEVDPFTGVREPNPTTAEGSFVIRR